MKAGKQNQSKIMKIVTCPLKILGKARDFYVRSMTACGSHGHLMSMPKPNGQQLLRSYSMESSEGGDDYSDLIRAASIRSLGHKNEIDMLLHQMKQQLQQKQLPKSCSAGMGFMVRIDEESGEDEGGSVGGPKKGPKTDMYSRSRSYAVSDRAIAAAF